VVSYYTVKDTATKMVPRMRPKPEFRSLSRSWTPLGLFVFVCTLAPVSLHRLVLTPADLLYLFCTCIRAFCRF
jgi:hypothetical protein